MTYKDKLHPWCVVRQLPDSQWQIVSRFRRRKDAEDHLQLIEQKTPTISYNIIFDSKVGVAK